MKNTYEIMMEMITHRTCTRNLNEKHLNRTHQFQLTIINTLNTNTDCAKTIQMLNTYVKCNEKH